MWAWWARGGVASGRGKGACELHGMTCCMQCCTRCRPDAEVAWSVLLCWAWVQEVHAAAIVHGWCFSMV